MKKVNIDVKEIEKIIGESVQSIEKITYGYTNEIYSINGMYILKICINERNRNIQKIQNNILKSRNINSVR